LFPTACSVGDNERANRPGATSDRRSLKILVVDDDPLIRDILTIYLVDDGHRVETAFDGSDGLRKFTHASWDLVLTDGVMPGMNGTELAAAIKKISPRTSVFLVTGTVELSGVGDVHSQIDRVIQKPFTRETLAAALQLAGLV
jgi:CheY-like chemotaxis protein